MDGGISSIEACERLDWQSDTLTRKATQSSGVSCERIVLGIGRLPGVIELAGLPVPSITGRTAHDIERPPDLRGREYGAEKQYEDENRGK